MKPNKHTKQIKFSWSVVPIFFILMAIILFFGEEHLAVKRRLPDPVQTEAALIKTYCGNTWRGKSRVPYLHLDYQYTTGSGKYPAYTGIYLKSKNDCEKATALANAEMTNKAIWYARNEHIKYTFSLEKPNTTRLAKISLVLALVTWLFGIFWRWVWSEEYQHFKGDVNTFR
jgi:hypothetical protein